MGRNRSHSCNCWPRPRGRDPRPPRWRCPQSKRRPGTPRHHRLCSRHGRGGGGAQIVIIGLGALVLGLLWIADLIRPGSFRRGRARDVSPIPWHLWLFAALATYLFLFVTAGAVYSTPAIVGPARDSLRAHGLVQLIPSIAASAAGVALIALLAPRAPRDAGLRPHVTDVPIGLGLFLLALPVFLSVSIASPAVYSLLTGNPADPVAHDQLRLILQQRSDPWIWPLIIAAAVGAPVVEELIYRVFLQSSVLAATRSHWAAILITSLLFTSVHAGSVPFYAMPVLFTLSLAMGLAYERTARPGVPITMHAAFNTTNILVTLAA